MERGIVMRAAMYLTSPEIENLDLLPGEKDVWIWDKERTGLGLRLRRLKDGTSSKTFYAMYRFGGQKIRQPLGDVSAYTLDDARNRAYELRKAVADGNDPRVLKAAKVAMSVKASTLPTFLDYAKAYLARRAKDLAANTLRERTRYLTGPHCELFHKLRLDQIDKATVAPQINVLEQDRSANVALFARVALADMFKLAVADGLIDVNPVEGTRTPQASSEGRERTLSDGELGSLWNACAGDDDYSKIIRLAILLGGRRQEIGGMEDEELDDAGLWTLPADRAKTDKDLLLPLPPVALEIVRSVPRREGRKHIFGGSRKNGFTRWSEMKRKLDARLPLKPWQLRDLRRTLITGMHDLGIEPHIVKSITNHSLADDDSRGSDVHNKHYNKAKYLAQKTEALRRWANHVQGVAGQGGSNVVEVKAAAA
jgi:integrase